MARPPALPRRDCILQGLNLVATPMCNQESHVDVLNECQYATIIERFIRVIPSPRHKKYVDSLLRLSAKKILARFEEATDEKKDESKSTETFRHA